MNRVLIAAAFVTFAACALNAPGEEARKTVTEAEMSLEVDDLTAAESKLLEFVTSRGGRVASMKRTKDGARLATLTVRVPAAALRDTVAAVSAIGRVSSVSTDSRDVTAETYDGSARISAKQVEERRLLRLLDTSSSNLQDVLAVEKELARVRSEIEELMGRQKVLDATTTTSALSVRMTEPAEPWALSVGGTMASSTRALLRALQLLVIVAAALLPWLGTLALCAAPFVALARRSRRRAAPRC